MKKFPGKVDIKEYFVTRFTQSCEKNPHKKKLFFSLHRNFNAENYHFFVHCCPPISLIE